MKSLKVGFIGAGFISRFQAIALQQVRGLDLVGVVSPNRAAEFASYVNTLGIGECKAYNSVKELCEACDIVGVFAPNFTRIDIIGEIVEAVEAGAELKAVICEKPLGRTMAEARELMKLAEQGGFPTIYFENQLHMKPIRAQLDQLRPQQLSMGPMSLCRCAEEHAGPHEGWFWDPVQQGGGVLSDMGCHSIACGWYCLTPPDKPLTYLEPVEISCDTALLKWGQPKYRERLLRDMGVDYMRAPAEDFATGIITFMNPDTGDVSKSQFTNSWMFDKQGLRLYMEGMGPGYAFELNSLVAPLTIFIGDEAAEAAADAETALEKSTATRGLLSVHHNEADIYGYVDEWIDARDSVNEGRPALADWSYGLEIVRLCMAGYMAAERKHTVDLTDPKIHKELETYVPLIAQGRGSEILHVG